MENGPQALHPLGPAGIWKKVFQVLLDDPDNRYVMFDSTIVQTPQQAVCGKGGAKVRLWGGPEED